MTEQTVTVAEPFAIRKRGRRKIVITPDGATAVAFRLGTKDAQSGASENIEWRESNFGGFARIAVRSFCQRSPQTQGIYAVAISWRERLRRSNWRREGDCSGMFSDSK